MFIKLFVCFARTPTVYCEFTIDDLPTHGASTRPVVVVEKENNDQESHTTRVREEIVTMVESLCTSMKIDSQWPSSLKRQKRHGLFWVVIFVEHHSHRLFCAGLSLPTHADSSGGQRFAVKSRTVFSCLRFDRERFYFMTQRKGVGKVGSSANVFRKSLVFMIEEEQHML